MQKKPTAVDSKMRWHYTIGDHMASILKDGFIKPATAFVTPPEKSIVWFTTSSNWEETANKGELAPGGAIRPLTRQETDSKCGGLFRIGVGPDYPLKRFMRITIESKQPRIVTAGLIESAHELGSDPYQNWFGTFQRVLRADWKAVEHHTPAGWHAISGFYVLHV